MKNLKLIILALAAFFVAGLRQQFSTANQDQGLLLTPNQRSFFRFTSRALFIPEGSIHGVDLGSILMVNASYGVETEKVPYAVNGSNVTAFEEAIQASPVWTIKGNQFASQLRELLLMGTKQTDVTIGVSAGSPQTITSAQPGKTYDLGVRGLTSFTSLTNSGATTTYVRDVDYEIDLITGMLRIIDGGAITTATTVIATYVSPSVVREKITGFDQQNRRGTLKCFGLRVGDSVVAEEGVFVGNLYADNIGDIDPKKHREWTMKISAPTPSFLYAKT